MTTHEEPRTDTAEVSVTVERALGHNIHVFSNMIQASYFRRTEQPLGITLPEWRVLRSVVGSPGQSQAEVAAAEALNVMNVSRAVAGLRRKRLITAEPDPNDGRRSLLSPTALGGELAEDMVERERVMYEHLFSVLSFDELVQVTEMFDRVNASIRSAELPPAPGPSRDWAAAFRDR